MQQDRQNPQQCRAGTLHHRGHSRMVNSDMKDGAMLKHAENRNPSLQDSNPIQRILKAYLLHTTAAGTATHCVPALPLSGTYFQHELCYREHVKIHLHAGILLPQQGCHNSPSSLSLSVTSCRPSLGMSSLLLSCLSQSFILAPPADTHTHT